MAKYDFSNYKAKRDQIPVKLKSKIQEINAGSEPAAVKAWMIEKAKEASKAETAKLRSEFNNAVCASVIIVPGRGPRLAILLLIGALCLIWFARCPVSQNNMLL